LNFLTDRFTEYQLLAVLLPLILYGSFIGYPLLQVAAIVRMRGSWRKASFVPLVPMALVLIVAATHYVNGSLLWPLYLQRTTPFAFVYLAVLWLASLWHQRAVRVAVLAVSAAGLILVASRQGLGWKLGGAPGTIEGEYKTEDAWIVTEIARDVAEMCAFNHGSESAPVVTIRIVRPGTYSVTSEPRLGAPVELELSDGLWNPGQFAKLAAAFLGSPILAQRDPFPSVQESLQEPTPERLVAVSESVSRALSLEMRNPAIHEAAAVTIAAFALREASGHFQDPRWALGRMTAHLAIARALSQGAELGIDGSVADAARLALSNEETRTIELLDRLEPQTGMRSARPWLSALRVRVTQDWRLMRTPGSGTLLEKSEYLRARRDTACCTRVEPDLAALGIDPTQSAHWLRIIQNGYRGVEEGALFMDAALSLEKSEASQVLSLLRGASADASDQDLNARSSRCIALAGPVVLPWGAWAEFFQRHLAMLVGTVNRQYTKGYGDEAGAQDSNREMDARLHNLSMFPVATTFRLRGPKGASADLRKINEAIDFASRQPERVTSETWGWLQRAASYEAIRRGMPPGAAWFAVPAVPYDAAFRAALPGRSPSAEELDRVRLRAPSDYHLAAAYLRAKYAERIPFAEVRRVLPSRLQYDLQAIRYARKYTANDDEQVSLLASSCEMNALECGELAGVLARLGRDDEAAAQYLRAFKDPSVDTVWKSTNSGWLVDYYYRHNRLADAVRLAEESAAVESFAGLMTLARLDEQTGKLLEAEALYVEAATHYDNFAYLLAFYLRRIRDHKDSQWQASYAKLLPTLFPEGMQPEPSSMSAKPAHGVIITADSDRARKAGAQAGDIIVGIEGIRVDNLPQYYAVNGSFETNEMKLTLWRGGLFHVATTAPGRLIGVQIRTYPIEGWAE
jgi:hypothetical protein